ncbi:MAG: hypothetical protein MUE40_11435 [Anaerolineae bacterium]|nr:hypothetical protein [Anaerolineae bacterium]
MRRFAGQQLLILMLYLGIAIVITFPVVLSLSTQFLGGDTSDSYEMARHIWWFKTALQTGQSPFWQSNLGYPEGFSGVSLQANFLQFFPMWLFAFVMPLATAFNLTILLTLALNGWSLQLWLRQALRRENGLPARAIDAGALLAGVVFMAAPTFQGHLFEGHAGLLVQWTVPLYLLALERFVAAPRFAWRWLALAVLFFQLAPSGHMLQVIYMLLPLTGVLLLVRLWQRDGRGAARIVLVGAAGSVLLLLFLLPLIQETLASAAYTDTGGYVRYSADLLAIVTPSFFHPLWGKLPYTAQVLGVNLGEGSQYIGLAAGLLALVGVRHFPAARTWLLLALVAWVLSLGPLLKVLDQPVLLRLGDYQTYLTLPLAPLQNLPGFNLARTPGRFNFALALALAALAGYGAAGLWARQPRLAAGGRTAGAAGLLLAALIVADYQSFFPVPTRPAAIPDAVYALRGRDDVRAVFNIPYEHLLGAKDALYLQTAHEKPLIAGQVTRQTPVNPARLALLQATLHPALLRSRGADIIIWHKQRAQQMGRYDALAALLARQFPPPIYEDAQIAIYETPADPAALPPLTTLAPASATLTDSLEAYVYAPQSRWLLVEATLTGTGQEVSLSRDGRPVQRLRVTGTQRLRVPLPLPADSFTALRLSLALPCPAVSAPPLTCDAVQVNSLSISEMPVPVRFDLIEFDRGIELLSSAVVPAAADHVMVYLDWRLSQPPGAFDIRFVHLLDSQGRNVAQEDSRLSPLPVAQAWSEAIRLSTAGLPPGEYTVRVGWYDLNTMQRFAVQTAGLPGGPDAAPILGTITLP